MLSVIILGVIKLIVIMLIVVILIVVAPAKTAFSYYSVIFCAPQAIKKKLWLYGWLSICYQIMLLEFLNKVFSLLRWVSRLLCWVSCFLIVMLSVIMLSVIKLIVVMLNVIMLIVVVPANNILDNHKQVVAQWVTVDFSNCYAECHYVKCHYAECQVFLLLCWLWLCLVSLS